MKLSKMGLKVLTIIISFCFIFSFFGFTTVRASSNTLVQPAPGAGEQIGSDTNGHWAELQLNKWLQAGLLHGYSNGQVSPDRNITRGELVALINRSFGFKEQTDISFKDLSAVDWQYKDVSIAVNAGYLSGYEDGTIRIHNEISRQEAAVMLGRILEPSLVADSAEAATVFTDASTIAIWSKYVVQQLADHKLLGGYEDGSFKPKGLMTRAEAVTILDRSLDWSAAGKAKAKTFDKAGVYGSAEAAETFEGDVVITTQGVTLRNMTITGDLLLAEGIGEGDVLLDRITVRGKTTVNGGGANSIHIRDSSLAAVLIEKKTGTVRIVLEGSTTAGTALVRSSVIIEAAESSKGGFTSIQVTAELTAGSKVTFKGDFVSIDVEASDATIEFLQGVIDKLTFHAMAKGSLLKTEKDTKIILLVLETIVKVLGQGTIEKANMNEQAIGTTFEKQPKVLEGAGAQVSGLSSSSITNSLVTSPPATSPPGTGGDGGTSQLPIKLVENGQSHAVVLVDVDASEQVLNAAKTLVKYVHKSTGVELPIQTINAGGLQPETVRVYVGISSSADQQQINGLLEGMNGDGFVIVPKENTITIIGPTAWGTEFGVDEFLERFVGVRWLLPGPDGEDVPEHQTINVALETIRDEPAAISRQFFGTETITTNEVSIPATNTEWARHNRIYENIQFHHHVKELFDPEVFIDHPEYYPDGVPAKGSQDWQPCLNDATAKAAIQRIIGFFDQNPEISSYSLGLNDSLNFCEAKPGHPQNPGTTNSIGYLNMSNIYYPWVNQIVEGVLEKYPDKYFGLLAYWTVYDAPTNVKLNSKVIPYITDDRMSWIDPKIGELGMNHTERWSQAATNLGFYEYLYGSPYNVPRVYPHKMAENYSYGKDKGVIAHVAELYPNFGEGPKPWISAKLQWNPDLNVDDLLNDWYVRAVGANAAPYLQQYYEYWEKFWTTRIFDTEWYHKWADSPQRYNYLNIFDTSYMKGITKEDMAHSRLLMEQVVALAQTDKQKIRADKLMLAFEYYEASVLSYTVSGDIVPPTNEQEAMALLQLMKDSSQSMEMAKKRTALLKQFETDPILNIPLKPPIYGGAWTGIQGGLFSALVRWIETEQASATFMEQLNEMAVSDRPFDRDNALLLLSIANKKRNLVKNPSFELADAGNPAQAKSWSYWWDGPGSVSRTEEIAKSGKYSLLMDNLNVLGGPSQDVLVEPGTYGVVLDYYTPVGLNPGGSIQWYMPIKDRDNKVINIVITEKLPFTTGKGNWTTMEAIFEVTEPMTTVQVGFLAWYLNAGEKIYVDNIGLYKLGSKSADPTRVTTVQAENGSIHAVFNRAPTEEPKVSDFSIEQQIIGETSKAVAPSAITWNAETLTAILTVPSFPGSSIERSMTYDVTFKDWAAVASEPVIIEPALNLINLVENASFEQGNDGNPAQATSWIYWTEGISWMSRTQAHVKTGDYSLVATDMNPVGGPSQYISVVPGGLYEAVVYYYSSVNTNSTGLIQWYINLWDNNNQLTGAVASSKVPIAGKEGTWVPLRIIFEVPATVSKLEFGFPLYYFKSGEQLFIDDVGLYRLDSSGSEPEPEPNPAQISAVQAENGRIEVVFDREPNAEPGISEFTIMQQINDETAVKITPDAVSWNTVTKKATLTVSNILASSIEQSVHYKVSIQNSTPVESVPFIITAATNLINVLENASFENGDATNPAQATSWTYWTEGIGWMSRTQAHVKLGDYSLVVTDINSVGAPSQYVSVEPGGIYEAVIYYYLPVNSNSSGLIQWYINLWDNNNNLTGAVATAKIPVAGKEGTWVPLRTTFKVPETVSKLEFGFPLYNFNSGEQLFLDDAAFYRLDN